MAVRTTTTKVERLETHTVTDTVKWLNRQDVTEALDERIANLTAETEDKSYSRKAKAEAQHRLDEARYLRTALVPTDFDDHYAKYCARIFDSKGYIFNGSRGMGVWL